MTRRRVIGCLALAALIAAGAPGPAAASFPGSNGSLAFSQWDPDVQDVVIRTIDRDGAGVATFGPGEFPSWSPDGSSLAFAVCCATGQRGNAVGFAPATGGPATILARTPGVILTSPEFSPTGDEVVYSTGKSIRVAPIDGSGSRKVVGDGNGCCLSAPTYSPDGRWIAFGGEPKLGRAGIWRVRPDGTGLRQLTEQPEEYEDVSPDYSPDGRLIVFERRRGARGIAVMRADGSKERTLPDTFFLRSPVFAPAGDRIAAVRVFYDVTKYPCGIALATMSPSGGDEQEIFVEPAGPPSCIRAVSWQPLP